MLDPSQPAAAAQQHQTTPDLADRWFEQQLGITPEVLRQVMAEALARGGTYADLYFEYSTRQSVVLEEGIVKSSSVALIAGMGVRVLQGDQTGYAYSETLELPAMLQAARSASAIARHGGVPAHEAAQFSRLVPPNYYPITQTTNDVSLSEKIRLLQAAEQAALETDDRVIRVTVATVESLTHNLVATSTGRLVADTRPMVRFNVHCVAEEEGNLQSGSSGTGGRRMAQTLLDPGLPQRLGREAAQDALLLLQAVQAPSGSFPVILGPAQSGILLHEAIGHPLEADFNRKGSSAYSGRIGEKVASDLCTIFDSGVIEHDRGAINFDDEGALSRENLLIEKGILRQYMHDYISAQHYELEPSGNGRRESYAHPPLPRMTTTYLAPGSSEPEEIFASVRKGVYCESFSGGQVDISNGDFVFVPTVAWLVEDGRKTVPLKNFTLIGNGPDALSKVTLVGNDFAFSDGIWTCGKDGQSVPVGVGLPTILISEMTVGGM